MSCRAAYQAFEEVRNELLQSRSDLRTEIAELKRRTEALLPLQRQVKLNVRKFIAARQQLEQALHADVSGILGARDPLEEALDSPESNPKPTELVAEGTAET
jgi:hypothetical protein